MTPNPGSQNSDRFILTILGLCAFANIAAFVLGRRFWDGHVDGIALSWLAIMFITLFYMGFGLRLSQEAIWWVVGICIFFMLFDAIVLSPPAVQSARS